MKRRLERIGDVCLKAVVVIACIGVGVGTILTPRDPAQGDALLALVDMLR